MNNSGVQGGRSMEEAASDPRKIVYIGMLPMSITEDELRDEVERYGKIDSLVMANDPNTK